MNKKNKRITMGIIGGIAVAGLTLASAPISNADGPQTKEEYIHEHGLDKPLVNEPSMSVTTDDGEKVQLNPKAVRATASQQGTHADALATFGSGHYWHGYWRTRHRHGCAMAVNVNKVYSSVFHEHLFNLTTRQHFCWGKKRVTRTDRSWDLDTFGSTKNFWQWDRWIWSHMHFFKKYRWKHSGHIQDRKGQIQEVIPVWGVVDTGRPVNRIHTYAHPRASGKRQAVLWMSNSI